MTRRAWMNREWWLILDRRRDRFHFGSGGDRLSRQRGVTPGREARPTESGFNNASAGRPPQVPPERDLAMEPPTYLTSAVFTIS